MTSSDSYRDDYELFDHCNQTELYQVARQAGHPVLPNYTRDALIRIIIGEPPPPLVFHEFDAWRRALIQFLLDHRRVLETQIACPARVLFTPERRQVPAATIEAETIANREACFGCTDIHVIHCVLDQEPNNVQLIQLRKKKCEGETR